MILVSSCLCGEKCKYNGQDNFNEKVAALCENTPHIKVCPEVLGGLSTPRVPAEIVGGTAEDVIKGEAKIYTQKGEDVTDAFIKGANAVIELLNQYTIEKAILKAKSPSCGKGKVYDGSFEGRLSEGNGVTAQMLLNRGIQVITEDEID